MEISNSPLTLFNYIGGGATANETLQNLANNNNKNIQGGINVLESGLRIGEFEETLDLMESGELDIDLNLVENYYQFNQQKINKEVIQLAEKFEIESEVIFTIQDGELVFEGDADNVQALQNYLDKDVRLNGLIQQTAKLSQFVEWGEAKNQAAEYQTAGMDEDQVVAFLQDARLVMTQDNKFIMSEIGSTYDSRGHTQYLIEQFSDNAE